MTSTIFFIIALIATTILAIYLVGVLMGISDRTTNIQTIVESIHKYFKDREDKL